MQAQATQVKGIRMSSRGKTKKIKSLQSFSKSDEKQAPAESLISIIEEGKIKVIDKWNMILLGYERYLLN